MILKDYNYSIASGVARIRARTTLAISSVTLGIVGLLTALAMPIAAGAASTSVYDAVPSPLPPNVASVGFEATSTSEFGDYVHLAGTNRNLNNITVTMSDWALFSDYSSDARYSANSTSWTHPMTVNVYSNHLAANGTPDTLLATKTQSVTIPWRPAADPTCAGGTAWRASDTLCYNGKAFNTTFDLSSSNVTLPNDIIVGVAYNTADYGATPIHQAGPYNSLNVGAPNGQTATVGTDDSSDSVFWNTSFAGFYADSGTAGVGIFRKDTGWTPNGTVAIQITASTPVPTNKDQCKNDGWKNLTDDKGKAFKNQGQCIEFVNHQSHQVEGEVKYNANGLNRDAEFEMNTANNKGTFAYSDANHGSYKVKVSSVKVSGNQAWFAGVVTKASDPSWVGNWLFAEVKDNSPDQIWGSFTDQTTAQNGVTNMTNPADGPFPVTKGNLKVN